MSAANELRQTEHATTVQPQEYLGSLRAWWLVGLFCLAAIVSYTDRLVLSALVDPIKHSLRVGDSAVSLLQGAAFAIVYVVSGLFLGRLADRKRRLRILIAGSTLWSMGTVACGLSPSFWLLFLSRVLVGIGEAALAPAAVSIIADSFRPTQRGTAIGIFMLGYGIGGPVSITAGSVMLSFANAGLFSRVPGVGLLEPWRSVLVLLGLAGLSIPVLFLTLREPARHTVARVLPPLAMVRRLAVDWSLLAPAYLAIGLLAVGDYGTLAWMPSVLTRRFGMTPAELGEIFGIITGGSAMLGCVLGGVGSDFAARRYGVAGRLRLALYAAALASIGAAMICSSRSAVALMGLGLWTLCSSIAAITGVAAIQIVVPGEYRGVGMAIITFCTTLLGLGCGPTAVALLTEYFYQNPKSVGFSITTIVLPAGLIAAILFLVSTRAVMARNKLRKAQPSQLREDDHEI